jgi:hypothetical protein
VAWEVELTDEAADWYRSLADREQYAIAAAIDLLAENGPNLGRPTVDTIKGSRHHNMKELRSRGGHLRMLFAFDPRRTAILLLGGDKRGNWKGWYEQNIPMADDLYDEYLREIRSEGRHS